MKQNQRYWFDDLRCEAFSIIANKEGRKKVLYQFYFLKP